MDLLVLFEEKEINKHHEIDILVFRNEDKVENVVNIGNKGF